jgi:hypothetical protein
VYNWIVEKQCTKCNQVKPLTEFHRFAASRDGHKARCKPCNSAESAAWQAANKDRYAVRYREWASKNRDKTRAASKRWNARNRGAHHARQVELHGREVVNARSRRWVAANQAKARAWKQQWKKNNPDAVAAMTAKRRSAMLNAVPLWANGEAIAQIYRACQAQPGHHVDHIVPLISPLVCGLHCEANLQIIPATDNYSKNNRYWPDMP